VVKTNIDLASIDMSYDACFDTLTGFGVVVNAHKWTSHMWARKAREMLDNAMSWIEMIKEDKLRLKDKLIEIVKGAFNTQASMKTIRFKTVLESMVSTMLKTYEDRMTQMFDTRVNEFYRNYSTDVYNNTGDMYLFKKTLYGFMLVEIVYPALESIYTIPMNTSTIECESYATKRAHLVQKLDSLYRARETITNIDMMLE
jgi:hypothetical protein